MCEDLLWETKKTKPLTNYKTGPHPEYWVVMNTEDPGPMHKREESETYVCEGCTRLCNFELDPNQLHSMVCPFETDRSIYFYLERISDVEPSQPSPFRSLLKCQK